MLRVTRYANFLVIFSWVLTSPNQLWSSAFSHPNDIVETSRERIIYTTPEYEESNNTAATSEGNSSFCVPIPGVKDIFEKVTTPSGPSEIELLVHLEDIDPNINLFLEVWNNNFEMDSCFYIGHDDQILTLSVKPQTEYYFRYYDQNPGNNQSGSFYTAFQADEGILRCPSGNITFASQSAIDSFAILYPNCKTIHGTLKVKETVSGNIQSLDSLYRIERIRGHLWMDLNLQLENLSGLENLQQIDDDFFCYYSKLRSISQLNSLETINGRIYFHGNDFLADDNLLPAIEHITGPVDIQGNINLQNLNMLSGIELIPNNLLLKGNPSLVDFSGLEHLKEIDQNLIIEDNNGLLSFDGLDSLHTIKGKLTITGNDDLMEITALGALTTLESTLTIDNNDQLLGLNGLEGLTTIGGNLDIRSNNSILFLEGLQNVNSVEGYLEISDNRNLLGLTHLGQITSLDGFLKIVNNDDLTSLTGLDNIEPSSIESHSPGYKDLTIKRNNILAVCDINSVCEAVELSGMTSDIAQNFPTCNSIIDISNACNNLVLPVRLQAFTVEVIDGDGILLKWSTSFEVNNMRYQIERLLPDDTWEPVGWMEGSGTIDIDQTYEWLDPEPQAGLNSYRLSQVDFDGQMTHLDIQSALWKVTEPIHFFPNPANTYVTLNQPSTYIITDLSGNPLLSGQGSTINIESLPKGLYLLQDGKTNHRVKLIKI